MGSLILCHNVKATHPYKITRIRRKVYTIEELCYYLCNNLYLIDYTIMNVQLCDWLDEELRLTALSKTLRDLLIQHGSIEQFVMTILNTSGIYSSNEIAHIQGILDRLRHQNETERKKFKADNLLGSNEVEAAIMIYLDIVHGEADETVDTKFYGRVYGCLGTAYGKLFLYEEAAHMFENGYQICEDESMLMSYIYCCYRYMDEVDYRMMVKKNNVFELYDATLKKKLSKYQDEFQSVANDSSLKTWKEEYRNK